MPEPYHTPTAEDQKLVDTQIDNVARSFVWNKNQLTPEIEAELDEILEDENDSNLEFLIAKHAEHEDEWNVIPPGAPEYRGK